MSIGKSYEAGDSAKGRWGLMELSSCIKSIDTDVRLIKNIFIRCSRDKLVRLRPTTVEQVVTLEKLQKHPSMKVSYFGW